MKDVQLWHQTWIVFLTGFTWFFAGFDLILLFLLGGEVGRSFFPNIDPTHLVFDVVKMEEVRWNNSWIGTIA